MVTEQNNHWDTLKQNNFRVNAKKYGNGTWERELANRNFHNYKQFLRYQILNK